MQLEKALKFIKDNGHSITKPRKKILELMAQKSTPLTGPQIYRKIKKDIDESTMYRNLQFLEKIGLVSCLRLDKRGSHYELKQRGHHHHHIQCQACGGIFCLDICSMNKVVEQISQKTGFKNIQHSLEFSGTCESCQQV